MINLLIKIFNSIKEDNYYNNIIMYNKELFDFICNGNIEKSLYNTCIFLIENSKIEILEDTLIFTCSYIGTFITIYNSNKFNDVINSTINIINSDNIDINQYLILITKMCILCDIHIKQPTTKTGTIPIPQLRQKIFNVFNNNINLNSAGIAKFDIIIPPTDSDIYSLTLKIITSFIQLFKILETISNDNIDDIYTLSVLFRDSFDYIIRKKYVIQTKFCLSEHDPIYFLWGFVHCLFNEPFILNYYKLFTHNNATNNKTLKNQRIGLIHGCAIAIIYSYKKDVITSWNSNEKIILNKIQDIGISLFKQIKKETGFVENIEKKDKTSEHDKNKIDGLNYIFDYIPKINQQFEDNNTNSIFEDEFRTIEK
jgi:hypothetical protein